ncbi:MAG: transporter substrate-binding domain-containing protein [Dysgonamonadaceae bacterium]|jgi:membrane-bound lytic murein transglycosylase MltF|nr:transporter substrate-binding domain-containing protein [Dysgonamonadaceae bacterium]
MNTKKILPVYFFLLGLSLLTMLLLWSSQRSTKTRDLPEIREEGILRIVTDYNSVGYYNTEDTIAGTQYALCKSIEKLSGLKVEIYLENSLAKSFQGLKNREYDIIARNIPITSQTKEIITFTNPVKRSKQVLVQRTAAYNNGIKPIRNQIGLAKKTFYVSENSPSILRIKNLAEEIADTIYIKEEKNCNSEQLIHMVANGEIDFAVADQEIAIKNKKNLPQIDVETEISFTQFQAWAIRKDSPVLLDSLNLWLKKK